MPTLRRLLASPHLELAVGLILLAAGLMEIRDIILVKMPNQGPMLPHAAATVGAALILRSLPGMFLGLEIIDRGVQGVSLTPAFAFLDRLAHSHAVDLFMGVVLVGAGLGDLIAIIASGGALPGVMGVNTATGAMVFGLAPAVNALLALYKGAR